MSTKNKDIVYGQVELDDQEFEPRQVKIRVTTFIDEDVLRAIKKLAKSKNQKYQTLLNRILRLFFFGKKKGDAITEDQIRDIVRQEMKKRA